VAHIAQKGAWPGSVLVGRMASAMYDAAQTPPCFRHIVNNRRMDDPQKTQGRTHSSPAVFFDYYEK
jgi:hypothetical protein